MSDERIITNKRGAIKERRTIKPIITEKIRERRASEERTNNRINNKRRTERKANDK